MIETLAYIANCDLPMAMSVFILAAVMVAIFVLLRPKLYGSTLWKATITPLASIIGSGFLILGPVLTSSFGSWATLAMAGLCGVAYLYGAAIRYNIAHRQTHPANGRLVRGLENVASWSLGFAYIVSVSYYLNLFGAFGVSLTPFDDPVYARLLTTIVFLLILGVGWSRGFHALEKMEQISVSIKLAIIVGLLVGLSIFFASKATSHELVYLLPEKTGWAAIALLFGLLVTVQGFETSRYLDDEYPAEVRIRTMRWAQWVSTLIYLVYIGLISLVFQRDAIVLSETGIIDMMKTVAPVLPFLLIIAALTAQFSAAVADTGGAGGLFYEVSNKRISVRAAYTVLVGVGVTLTWVSDVFDIIRYASLAFAIYYTLQALIALLHARKKPGTGLQILLYFLLVILGVMIVVFGKSVEG